jgi:hypothetical protein
MVDQLSPPRSARVVRTLSLRKETLANLVPAPALLAMAESRGEPCPRAPIVPGVSADIGGCASLLLPCIHDEPGRPVNDPPAREPLAPPPRRPETPGDEEQR